MDPQLIRLLIGEDDLPLALEMQRQLQSLGYCVQVRASTPHEVVAWATVLHPDVILLNLNIGGETHGIEVARDLHDITIIPTVFLSTFLDDMTKNAHAIPRPYRYVIKPFAIGDVHAAIQDLLT